MTHIAGKWAWQRESSLVYTILHDGQQYIVANVDPEERFVPWVVANTCTLFAASPDMLYALQRAEQALHCLIDGGWVRKEGAAFAQEELKNIRWAIEEATTEAQ